MALIEINLRPSDRDMRWFGLIVLLFFCFLATIIWRASGTTVMPATLVLVGVVLCGVYYLVKPLRRFLYLGWMRAIFPIGWVMSHALIGVVYFGVVTPVGWLLRLTGRDPMKRAMLRSARTYWVERQTTADPSRYFRQY